MAMNYVWVTLRQSCSTAREASHSSAGLNQSGQGDWTVEPHSTGTFVHTLTAHDSGPKSTTTGSRAVLCAPLPKPRHASLDTPFSCNDAHTTDLVQE
jgi:hypothetical protein